MCSVYHFIYRILYIASFVFSSVCTVKVYTVKNRTCFMETNTDSNGLQRDGVLQKRRLFKKLTRTPNSRNTDSS